MPSKHIAAHRSVRVMLLALSIFSITTFSTPTVRAGIWGESIFAGILQWVLDTLSEQIKGMLLGGIKSAAIQTLNSEINRMVGGTSAGKAMFITNYETFLFQNTLQKTNLYMNDFFTISTRGTGASANYIGVGDLGGLGGNYASYLVEQAKQATVGTGQQGPQMTLDQYTSSPQQMFQEGDWRAFNAFFSNPANNVFGYTIMAEQQYQSKLATEQTTAQTKATSSGYLPTEKNGSIITPSGSIEAMTGKVQSVGVDILANASNIGEGIVAAAVSQLMNKILQQGIGQVQANIQKEVNGVKSEIGSAQNDAFRNGGPGTQFSASVTQRTGVNINPGTPAPPSASLLAGSCVSYNSSSVCQPQANCTNGYTKANCSGGLVCCYAQPAATTTASGGSCSIYNGTGTCQLQGNCHSTYIQSSSCSGGLVCCYNP